MTTPTHDELVGQLRKLLADGWTVASLAAPDALGCSRGAVYTWLNGTVTMSPMTRRVGAAVVEKVDEWNDMAQLYGETNKTWHKR